MTMSATEKKVIRNVVKRLRCEPRPDGQYRESPDVRLALSGCLDPAVILDSEELSREAKAARPYVDHVEGKHANARLYINTWLAGALECLLDEEDGGTGRDPQLALRLSE